MTLKGVIRNAAGQTQPRTVEAPAYPTAKAQLVSDGSELLWIRRAEVSP